MRILLYAKMLKETITEKTVVFFVTFLSLVAFQLGGGAGPLAPSWLRLCPQSKIVAAPMFKCIKNVEFC